MGYTHYWELKPATLPKEAVRVLQELLSAAHALGVVQYEFDTPQPPLVSDTEIRFNGVGEQGHETFHFLATGDGGDRRGRTFQFCKTARKPYDEVVMQVLIVLKHYLGDAITVTSDGDFEVEWAAARRELARRYGVHTAGAGAALRRPHRHRPTRRGTRGLTTTPSVLPLTHLTSEAGERKGSTEP